MVKKEIIKDAVELTKNIPSTDVNVSENNFDNGTTYENGNVLTPLQQIEEAELTPYPQVEYDILFDSDVDKLIRNVNNRLANGWVVDGGVQVVATASGSRFYQAMERWVVPSDFGLKSEMPIENSKAECLGSQAGPLGEGMKFLENEPDLYEDITKDATDG